MKRENDEKLQSLESIVKIFEIKARNASDHVSRLEEKENETKQEYKRLHERYCEVKDSKDFLCNLLRNRFLVIQSSLRLYGTNKNSLWH